MIKSIVSDNKTINIKGQKIIAAIYLVTNHTPEGDPFRHKIRELALSLVDFSAEDRGPIGAKITSLLGFAVLAGLISDTNSKIIESEIKYFTDPVYHSDETIANLFPSVTDKGHILSKRTTYSDMSFMNKPSSTLVLDKKPLNKDNKNKRQDKILSYINDRKSATIKDIASLFSDVSEKTIQRELGVLVSGGKITKRGNKRWSIYLSV